MIHTLSESCYLARLIAHSRLCDIFLINGVKLQGVVVVGLDEHCLFVLTAVEHRATEPTMLMKSAVSSIVPLSRGHASDASDGDLDGLLCVRSSRR